MSTFGLNLHIELLRAVGEKCSQYLITNFFTHIHK